MEVEYVNMVGMTFSIFLMLYSFVLIKEEEFAKTYFDSRVIDLLFFLFVILLFTFLFLNSPLYL